MEASLVVCATIGPRPIIKRSFKRVNVEDFRRRALQIQLDTSDLATPDDMLNHWNGSMSDLLDELAPLKAYPECKKDANG